jgi:hypothetical protein
VEGRGYTSTRVSTRQPQTQCALLEYAECPLANYPPLFDTSRMTASIGAS